MLGWPVCEMAVHLLSLVMSLMVSYFVLSFFPRDVSDEIWDSQGINESAETLSVI